MPLLVADSTVSGQVCTPFDARGACVDIRPMGVESQPPADPNIGRVIAERYRIDSVIAKGGMGAVYRGEHVHMRKQVALKLLHADSENLPELVARFERESIVGAHVRHPHVGMATDFGKDRDGSYYLVMEYVDGVTLKSIIREGPLERSRAVRYALQIAEGIAAIHELDIVHRDLNPRNVMITSDDEVKLIDFGFAKVPVEKFAETEDDEALRITSIGEVFGTIGFIAPEAAYGMMAVDKPGDLYALGVIFYEMLTGKHPFDEKGHAKLFQLHATAAPPPPSTRAPRAHVAPALEAVIMRLLEKSPGDRYADASEVIEAIERAAKTMPPPPLPSAPPSSLDEAPALPMNKSWGLRLLLVALVGAAAAVYFVPDLRERALALVRRDAPAEAPASATVATTSAAPPPTATASASATAVPRPTEIDGVDADGWETVLRGALSAADLTRSAKALLALAEIAPQRFADPKLRRDAAAATIMIALGDQKKAESIFALLASDALGAGGPDVLFRMITHHGGSRGAERAAQLLARREVAARASPALAIAMEMRATSCGHREALFKRAVEDGDERVLAMLVSMDAPECIHTCCLRYNSNLDEAIRALRDRL